MKEIDLDNKKNKEKIDNYLNNNEYYNKINNSTYHSPSREFGF